MNFLTTVFGRKTPTSTSARAALDRVEADLVAAPARIAAAEAVLARVADLSADEHAAADLELAEAGRAQVRLAAQAGELRRALAEAEKADAVAALAARAKAAGAKLEAYAGLVDRHDRQAAALAETLAAMSEVETEIATVNRAIDAARRAGLAAPDEVETPDARFRAEPDVVTPDRKIVEDKVVSTETSVSYGPDGEERRVHREVPVGVTVTRGDKLVLRAGEHVAKVERVIPGRLTRGRRISSPTSETKLAPARVGGAAFWPKGS